MEDAVIEHLGAVGRASFHAENWFWVSLFALVFRDLYFLPVPGMLPTARRSGPLDLGTPGFAARRRTHVEGRLAEVESVGVGSSSSSWTGERLAGLALPDIVGRWAGEVPGPMAAAILGRMAWEGWSAARGLPDLFVAAGTAVDVPGAIPRRLRNDAFLVELKAPGDKMRSYQVMWGHHLTRRGIPVELWTVSG